MADELQLDSYLPLYDTVPEKWEEGREFLIEVLKKISEMVNIRQIGWFLDEELLSGKQFIPGANNPQEYRSIFRVVVDCSPLVAGVNTFAHNINVDINFTLVQMYAAATDSISFLAQPIPNGADTISMDATNVIITSAAAWDRAFCCVEYIQEL